MRKLLLLLCLAVFAVVGLQTRSAHAASFVVTYAADTASASTVKLIKNGKVFSDITDVYTMTWNATRQVYETTSLDDGTFINGYYRIEAGSGNIVIDTVSINSAIIDADQLEDKFVRNDGDDMKRGNLQVRPASGTTNVELLIDNSSTTMQITATDTGSVSTSGHILQLQASSIDLQTSGGSDIPITGIGQSSTANSAVTRANIDTLKGTGWTWDSGANTIMGLRDDLDAIIGTGTFTANDSLFLTGSGGGGSIALNWNFDPVAVNDSVDYYEIYYSQSALAGYSQSGAAALSTGTLSSMRSTMKRMGLPDRDGTTTTFLSHSSWYFIVVGFDHSDPAQAWGSNQVLVSGGEDELDSNVPLIGGSSVVSGLGQLANEVSALQSGLSSSGAGVKVWYASNFVGAAGAAPTEVTWYQAAAAATQRILFTFYKDVTFNTLRFRFQSTHDGASKSGTFYLGSDAGTATKTVTHSATPDTWQDSYLTQDVSALDDGIYQGSISIEDGSSTTADTLFIRRVIVESIHQ